MANTLIFALVCLPLLTSHVSSEATVAYHEMDLSFDQKSRTNEEDQRPIDAVTSVNDKHRVSANMHDFRAHDLKRFVHLRNKVDRLQLQQKTDRIKLEILQKTVENLLYFKSSQIEPVTNEKQLSEKFGKNVPHEDGSFEQARLDEEIQEFSTNQRQHQNLVKNNQDDNQSQIEMLRADVVQLRKDLEALTCCSHATNDPPHRKQPTASEFPSSAKLQLQQSDSSSASAALAYSPSAEDNLRKEILWIKESQTRLQNIQQDLEEKCNVTVIMHDKQKLDSRLVGLTEGLAVLQEGLSQAAARASATDAHVTSLSQDGKETTSAIQKADARIATLENEVTSLREDFNEALSALPDGALSPAFYASKSNNDSRPAPARLLYSLSGLSKLQRSSVELLEAVDNLQSQHEASQIQLTREMADLEFNVSRALVEHQETLKRVRASADSEANLASDLRNLRDEMQSLKLNFDVISANQSLTSSNIDRLEAKFAQLFGENAASHRSARNGNLRLRNLSHNSGTRSEIDIPGSINRAYGTRHRRRKLKRKHGA
ncbi:uncharacterized protein LOC108676007 [Hyalella azteca]|uniref:Uncharacterized protein LOC108676007 n=1 Tax=Hyalella azteca TaxID=294128 RepID=A0A8B7P0J9_HYAAZ|nr:uncharacterized protein LOC108676007 [Hyalella azteca]